MQTIEVRARVIRQIYNNGDYYIFALVPSERNNNIKLNSYGNFTVTGELGYLSLNKEYTETPLSIDDVKKLANLFQDTIDAHKDLFTNDDAKNRGDENE